MLFHASPVKGINVLMPCASNHGRAMVYMSGCRENVLVYLSNAVEKFCRETGFEYAGIYHKWASYGFTRDGILQLDEYYPGATEQTYRGVDGYIYSANGDESFNELTDVLGAFTSDRPVRVNACEYVPDAYEAIMQAAARGEIKCRRYEDNSPAMLDWIKKSAASEYAAAADHPEYRAFLKAKFDISM